MEIVPAQNAAASKIAVTGTATGIYALINTAGSTNLPRAGYSVDTNGIDITVEDGDVRVLFDGNTPTATLGMLLSSGNVYRFRSMPLENMKLIRTGGSNVACSVELGKSDRAEVSNSSPYAAATGGGSDEGVVTPTSALSNFLNSLPFAIFHTTPTVRTNNQGGPLEADANGNLKATLQTLISGEDQTNNVLGIVEVPVSVSTYTPSLDTSAAAEASSVSKGASGVLYGCSLSNGNASARYFQFFNSNTLPADTTVPVITLLVPGNSTAVFEWPKGRYFSTGIVWCNSTTQNTKTIGSADSLADINYK